VAVLVVRPVDAHRPNLFAKINPPVPSVVAVDVKVPAML
jgi:hypothetical protein